MKSECHSKPELWSKTSLDWKSKFEVTVMASQRIDYARSLVLLLWAGAALARAVKVKLTLATSSPPVEPSKNQTGMWGFEDESKKL